jgi:external thioesterase TEII
MVDLYIREIPAEVFADSVLLGHSLGGLVALATALELHRRGAPVPGLILSAVRPPHCKGYVPFTSLDDRQLLETMIELGGVPAEWADEPETFDLFKDSLRADFRAFESFEAPRPLEGSPTFVVGAYQDVVCRPEHVFEWTRYCPGCQIDFVPGEHLFIQSPPERFVSMLNRFAAGLTK